MSIILPSAMLAATSKVLSKCETFYRNGVALEKGAVITEKRIQKNIKLYQQYLNLFASYPDLYLELIKPVHSKFKLKFFQVMFIRACLRYGRVLTIAPRAAGKSFICILALYLICISVLVHTFSSVLLVKLRVLKSLTKRFISFGTSSRF